MKPIVFLFSFILLISCNSKQQDAQTINFNFENKSSSSIATNVITYKIIPLETKDECFFSTSTKIKVYGSKIFILENILGRRDQILIFGMDGKFISKINSQGRGPDEYININDFDIDKKRELISILDPGLKKIKNYDLNSKFVDEIKLDFYAKEFLYSSSSEENYTVFSTLMSYSTSAITDDIYAFDNKNKLIYSALPFKKTLGIILGSKMHFFPDDDGVSYLKPNSNEVYNITSHQANLKYILKFSYDILPNEEIENTFFKGKNILNKYIYSIHYYETSNYIFTQFMHNSKPFVGLYDKNNENSAVFEDQKDPSCGCGVTFKIKGIFENSLILECDYSTIEKTLNVLDPGRTKCSNLETYRMLKNDLTSNPILVLVEFRNNK